MQIFLPYPDIKESVCCLDNTHLAKQRQEALQIWNFLQPYKSTHSWASHPAVCMWRGYELALLTIGAISCLEYAKRGHKDILGANYVTKLEQFSITPSATIADIPLPRWWNDDRLHNSHRSLLLSRNPTWFRKFNWNVKPSRDIYWPTNANETEVRRVIRSDYSTTR